MITVSKIRNRIPMITFVNMFIVKIGQQNAAFAGIQQVYTEVVKFQEGFISAMLLKSDDGNTVTAIAQWETALVVQKTPAPQSTRYPQ
jgi:heme-degrading monooxygenase HmoA